MGTGVSWRLGRDKRERRRGAGRARAREEQAGGRSAIRLFVEAALDAHAPLALTPAQAHYLRAVMRQAPGDRIRLFNGRDGEWEGTIESLTPRAAAVRLGARLAAQTPAPDVRLLFAPLKATTTRFVVQKATELGVGAIHPVLTQHGQTRRINVERLRTHAIEAAQQCGRLDVPQVAAPLPPRRRARRLAAGAPAPGLRSRGRTTAAEALAGGGSAPWAILIGPEGGFAPEERACSPPIPRRSLARLGPRILRAETAAAAALACFQALAGDWR